MPVDVKPGTSVSIKVRRPPNEAGCEDIVQTVAKDAVIRRPRVQRKKLLAGAVEVGRRGVGPGRYGPRRRGWSSQ